MQMQKHTTPRPYTGVSVAVFGPQGVLLAKRGKPPFQGYWSLPGGSQEYGELLEDAARRELHEETGLVAQKLAFAQIVEPMAMNDAGEIVSHFVLAVFVCREFSGAAVAGDDAAEIRWAKLTDLDALQTTPGTAELIKRLHMLHN